MYRSATAGVSAWRWEPEADLKPSLFESVMGTNLIMQQSIIREQFKHRPPTIYLVPTLHDIKVLDFAKADSIYQQTAASKQLLRKQLKALASR